MKKNSYSDTVDIKGILLDTADTLTKLAEKITNDPDARPLSDHEKTAIRNSLGIEWLPAMLDDFASFIKRGDIGGADRVINRIFSAMDL